VHFFDYPANWKLGADWWDSQFPTSYKVVGESSPTYLQHPLVHARILETCPDLKFIVMLRNPVDRAWSEYHLAVKKGWTSMRFMDWIKREVFELVDEQAQEGFWERDYFGSKTHLLGFLDRGEYATHLERWFDVFPRDQFFIIKSEDMFNDPHPTMTKVHEFLELKDVHGTYMKRWHKGKYQPIPAKPKAWLNGYYDQPNMELAELLGGKFRW
jgi:hypothetical protein